MESRTGVVSVRHECSRQDNIPLEIVRAGLHWSLRISKQMLPLELILGW
jgi:hypothetical protein